MMEGDNPLPGKDLSAQWPRLILEKDNLHLKKMSRYVTKSAVTSTHFKVCLLILVGALLCAVVILSAVPPISRDALTQHLAVPKLYIKHGGMYEIPSMPASYNPMN